MPGVSREHPSAQAALWQGETVRTSSSAGATPGILMLSKLLPGKED